ncbi:MAG: GtrA family protein [Usitatibacter sp.]
MMCELRRMAAYVVAGLAATGTHYVVMIALVSWARWPEILATCAGFLAGACVKYPLNYWGVFASRQRHRVAVPRFVFALAGSFVLNAALFALLLRILDVHYMVSQVLTTGAVLVVNYLLARYWIFLARPGRDEESA